MRVGVEDLGVGGAQALHLGQERSQGVGIEGVSRAPLTGPHHIRTAHAPSVDVPHAAIRPHMCGAPVGIVPSDHIDAALASDVAWDVVIAGGGFGGFYAARALERLLPANSARVTLVNDANFMLYTPLLPGAAGATLDPRHVVVPLRSQLRRTDLVIGQVTGGDPARRTLGVKRIDGEQIELGYDQLIVALGSVSRTLPIPGLAEHAIGLKSLSDATALRNRVLSCLDIAESLEDPAKRAEYLGFVFVGAGYAGVEGLAELQDFAAQAIELYPRCRAQGMRWVLVEAKDRIMQEVPQSLSEFAARELRARGIEVRTETTLEEITERERDALRRRADPGAHGGVDGRGQAEPRRRQAGSAARSRRTGGRGSHDARGRATQHVWAIGDCAAVPDPARKGSRARRPHSTRSARGGWSRATSPRRSATAGCGRSATAPKELSPSSATARPSRSRSACAGAACRRGSSRAPITCC